MSFNLEKIFPCEIIFHIKFYISLLTQSLWSALIKKYKVIVKVDHNSNIFGNYEKFKTIVNRATSLDKLLCPFGLMLYANKHHEILNLFTFIISNSKNSETPHTIIITKKGQAQFRTIFEGEMYIYPIVLTPEGHIHIIIKFLWYDCDVDVYTCNGDDEIVHFVNRIKI